MARPNKSKVVGRLPVYQDFLTQGREETENKLILSVEEFETLRLLDYLGMTQEECAGSMQVGRATVQMLYTEARKKVARFLVEGTALLISGGNYQVGQGTDQKGVFQMKIAVTYADGMVFQHFGHTEQFKIYEVEDGKVVSSQVVDTNGHGHGALAGFLREYGVNTLICGGIGGGARNALAECGIELFPGAAGNADEQVESFLSGKLSYDPNTRCNHHGEGHTCGGHGHEGGHHGCGGHGHEDGHHGRGGHGHEDGHHGCGGHGHEEGHHGCCH